MSHITLDEIKDKLEFFCKMYDVARLVDPLAKRVLEYQESSVCATQQVCHDYWENGIICDNCISIRAHRENSSFVKLEKNPESVFLVTAIPIENSATPAVLELLKDATETMLVGSGDYAQGQLFHRYVGQMNALIVRDALTSLYNRRFADERLPADIVEATIQRQPLSVCFLDMDNFKAVNDVCGHKAGDAAIQAVGNVIARQIRADQDWAARYGGDEFVLCLHNTEEAQARAVARRIQEEIQAICVDYPAGQIALSMSWGIQTMTDVLMTAEELIRSADQQMYQAKRRKGSGF